MLILGTEYAGEMKKGIFSVMHYMMPCRDILTLHSGCNVGKEDDVTLFFGLSGTGTTAGCDVETAAVQCLLSLQPSGKPVTCIPGKVRDTSLSHVDELAAAAPGTVVLICIRICFHDIASFTHVSCPSPL